MALRIIDPRQWIAIGYVRRSREDAEAERFGKNETLAKQHRIIELIAKDDFELEVTEWFEEIESGETIAGRPEFIKLMQGLLKDKWLAKAQGKRMALFAKEPSRLGRGSGADRDRIINLLKVTKTYFVTPEKVYDSENPKDLKLLRKELEDATDEREVSVARLCDGVKDAVRAGCYVGGVEPYGWRKVRINRKWTLEPDPIEHPRLMTMYDLVDYEGYTPHGVKLYAEEQGWPTSKGKLVWKKQTIRDILCNDLNAGYVTHGKHKIVDGVDKETLDPVRCLKIVGEEDPDFVRAEGLHMGNGTISMERLERVRRKIHTGVPLGDEREIKNMFAGILRCGKCGYAMTRRPFSSRRYASSKQEGKPYVRIEHGDDVSTTCRCKGAPFEDVVNCLVEALKIHYADLEFLLTDNGKKKERERVTKRVKRLQKELETANTACNRIRYAWETARYTDAEFDERMALAKKQVASIEKAIADELAAMPDVESIEKQMVTCADVMEVLLDDEVSAKEKNDFLKSVIDHIDYYNDAPPRVRKQAIRLEVFFL